AGEPLRLARELVEFARDGGGRVEFVALEFEQVALASTFVRGPDQVEPLAADRVMNGRCLTEGGPKRLKSSVGIEQIPLVIG
ncbi:hypothetical protein, partial [Escherichia coli]